MTPPPAPGIPWRKVAGPRHARGLIAAVILAVLIVVMFPALNDVLSGHGAFIALLAFLAGPGLLVSRALKSGNRWNHVGFAMDDYGVTVGGRTVIPPDRLRYAAPQALRYRAPWTAIYDVTVVVDPAMASRLELAAWEEKTVGRSSVDVAARPPFLPGPAPVLVFRVDLRFADVPDVPPPYLLSHVWAVPVHDVEAVVHEFESRGIPVTRRGAETRYPVGLGPADGRAMKPEFYRAWLADPVVVDERRPSVHRTFDGPPPRNLAEYEAACFFEFGDTRRLTDEIGLWADERWLDAHLTSDGELGARSLRSLADYGRLRRKERRDALRNRRQTPRS